MTPAVALFLDEIDALLDGAAHDWAGPTLRGIYDTVRRTDVVTPGQRQAVANIAAGSREGLLPSDKFRSSRRYENWAPGGLGGTR
jgi:hypothetical protein